FFSSRSGHTRSTRDWSADVCSSDLEGEDHPEDAVGGRVLRPHVHDEALGPAVPVLEGRLLGGFGHGSYRSGENGAGTRSFASIKIGRASCREGVYVSRGGVSGHRSK